ncbi:hypothetical protein AAFF_G00000780 [Aldrovandia affinis]|uniref:2-oxo-4-hydroxy-4-carboxy-5-ureidoimidazoline decarboxylase n=1 Tax=Aldrovandia affinis TaxID=143900 RepID=A0AAD7TCR7_9TELE|nr:hypothetical protein AAFF_G00000780 [Aldrovandia affinis]
MDISVVISLSYEEFMESFGNVVEKYPLVAATVWSQRLFASIDDIEGAFAGFLDSLPDSDKEGVLRRFPDLAGREFRNGTLSPESQLEQNQAGMTRLEPAEAACITALNTQYKQRFGFPFVICGRMNDKHTILLHLHQRLTNEHSHELACAIEEVKKICHLRLQSLVCPTQPSPM